MPDWISCIHPSEPTGNISGIDLDRARLRHLRCQSPHYSRPNSLPDKRKHHPNPSPDSPSILHILAPNPDQNILLLQRAIHSLLQLKHLDVSLPRQPGDSFTRRQPLDPVRAALMHRGVPVLSRYPRGVECEELKLGAHESCKCGVV